MSPVDGEVLRANGMKTVAKYIVCRKGVIMQWVALRPIFSVSAWGKGFEGGGWWRKPCWRKEAPDEVLRSMLA